MTFRILKFEEYPTMLPLLQELNPKTDRKLLLERLSQMNSDSYECLGAFDGGKLIGICGMWFCVKVYTGLQMEIDNVAVDPAMRSQKVGAKMMEWVYNYARKKGCYSVELNTYVGNSRSHKFYMNEGFRILGFHMQKVVGV